MSEYTTAAVDKSTATKVNLDIFDFAGNYMGYVSVDKPVPAAETAAGASSSSPEAASQDEGTEQTDVFTSVYNKAVVKAGYLKYLEVPSEAEA